MSCISSTSACWSFNMALRMIDFATKNIFCGHWPGFCSQKASMYACCMVNDSVGWARDPETTLNLNPMPVNHLTMISMDFGSRSMFTLEFLAQGRPFYSRQDSLPRNGVTPRWNRGDLSRSCYFEVVRTKHPGRHLDILCHFMTSYILIHDIFPFTYCIKCDIYIVLYSTMQILYIHCI